MKKESDETFSQPTFRLNIIRSRSVLPAILRNGASGRRRWASARSYK